MERGRKTKVIAILALVVAVVTMSLGFAVFSNVLTISSSATVKPNESEFKMKAYGVVDFYNVPEDLSDISQYTSDTRALGLVVESGNASIAPTATEAIIDNSNGKNITISNVSANLTGPGQFIAYQLVIKNEGSYNAYLDFSKFDFDDDGIFFAPVDSCVGGDGATSSLVESACDSIYAQWQFLDSSFKKIEYDGMYEIAPNSFIAMQGGIVYENNGILADGPITIDFEDVVLEFTSVSGANS